MKHKCMLREQIQVQVQLATQCFLMKNGSQTNPCSLIRKRLSQSIPVHSSGKGKPNNLQRTSKTGQRVQEASCSTQTKVPKSKAAPTKNNATPAAKKTHAARGDSLLPKTFTTMAQTDLSCVAISPMIQCPRRTSCHGMGYFATPGTYDENACKDLVLKGGATKAKVIDLKSRRLLI